MYTTRLLLTLACLPLLACLAQGDERCGTNQMLDPCQGACVCADNTVLEGNQCKPCPDDEVARAGSCECPDDLFRDTTSGACVPAVAGLGASCSDNEPCLIDGIGACIATPVDAYCTTEGCASSDDCEAGYACNQSASPSYCQRPPLGLGTPCETESDCAGGEATYCENFQTNQCMVIDCSEDSCFEGWECCDLRPLGFTTTMCTPDGQCPV